MTKEAGWFIAAIDHVQLAMPPGQEAKARLFYEDILGIPEQPKPDHLAGRGGCWFERGSLRIHLGVEDDFRPAKKAHPALLVSDLKALEEKLGRLGVTLKTDEPLEGYVRFYADDPFGNRLEFLEKIQTEPSTPRP